MRDPRCGAQPERKPDSIASTIWFDRVAQWEDEVELIDFRTVGFLRHQWRVLRAARTHRTVVLMGAVALSDGLRDFVSALLIKALILPNVRPALVFADATWDDSSIALAARVGTRASAVVARLGIRALDGQHVHYCVLSSAEREIFPRTWDVDTDRVWFTPFPVIISDRDVELANEGIGSEIDVFAGGNNQRDYAMFVAALRHTAARGVIATSNPVALARGDTVRCGALSHSDYMRHFGSARVVAVPLNYKRPRSAGQQTYLGAAALGKPIVVNDAPGVRDYFEHREHALIVPNGDSRSFADAIDWCLQNESEAREMGQRARRWVESRYTPLTYSRSLLEIARSVAR